jgi:hypothetical protein
MICEAVCWLDWFTNIDLLEQGYVFSFDKLRFSKFEGLSGSGVRTTVVLLP